MYSSPVNQSDDIIEFFSNGYLEKPIVLIPAKVEVSGAPRISALSNRAKDRIKAAAGAGSGRPARSISAIFRMLRSTSCWQGDDSITTRNLGRGAVARICGPEMINATEEHRALRRARRRNSSMRPAQRSRCTDADRQPTSHAPEHRPMSGMRELVDYCHPTPARRPVHA